MKKLSSPFIHSGASTNRIMLDVVIALVPAAIAAVVLFGAKAVLLIATCIVTCVLSEAVFNALTHKKQTIGDCSAVVTGLLLGLNLSTAVPAWQAVVGSIFAIIVVKCFFGGLGCNFVNPAIAARVFMLISFSAVAGGMWPNAVDAVSSATPLEMISHGATENLPTLGAMFMGLKGGCIGETCALALLIGFAYLLVRKVITWHIPVVFIATVFVLSLVASGSFNTAVYEVLGGGLLLGAIFMATDYVTSPVNTRGRVVYAVGCGLITFLVRWFGSYPEGVSFSILIMNILAPHIERWTAVQPLGGVKHAG